MSSDINEVFGCKKDGGGSLEDHIKCLCQELLRVLKDNRQFSPVMKFASELLSTLLNFSSDQGTEDCSLVPRPSMKNDGLVPIASMLVRMRLPLPEKQVIVYLACKPFRKPFRAKQWQNFMKRWPILFCV